MNNTYITFSETLDELAAMSRNPDSVHMEGLAIRERILGPDHPDLWHPIIYRGAVFADNGRFDRCVRLWLHALKLQQRNNASVEKDILRFAQVFSQMLNIDQEVHFSDVAEVLSASKCVIQTIMNKLDGEEEVAGAGAAAGQPPPGPEDILLLERDLRESMNVFLYLVVIFTKVTKRATSDERFQAMKSIYQVREQSKLV